MEIALIELVTFGNELHLALAVFFVVTEVASVHILVGVSETSKAIFEVVPPVAFILLAIRQDLRADSVLHTINDFALKVTFEFFKNARVIGSFFSLLFQIEEEDVEVFVEQLAGV